MRMQGFVAMGIQIFLIAPVFAQPLDRDGVLPAGPPREQSKRGLLRREPGAFDGFTLFAPLNSTTTYLVDMDGKQRHTWPSKYTPGQSVTLLDDGSILRCAREPNNRHFQGGGIGGRIERIAADGKVTWELVFVDEQHCQHHDIELLPNGNILILAWEKKSKVDAIASGRDPKKLPANELWPDCVFEVRPSGDNGGEIVWEWHAWDHLIQDFDESKKNFGIVGEHVELIDLNYDMPRRMPRAQRQRLRDVGYMGGAEPDEDEEDDDRRPPKPPRGPGGPGRGPGPGKMAADWLHTNAVAYNAKLDQIALSIHNLHEIWIIDHSTTTKEAASHAGGKSGKGGDLLYRWGNPRAYRAGDEKDQTLFAQHDIRWIPEGSPGAGNLLVFNNGEGRPDGAFSSVIEFAAPVDPKGKYQRAAGMAFGPSKPVWEYTAEKKSNFFSSHISGAERLPNGNTLICSGEPGQIFEVTPAKQLVWDYLNPYLERNGPREDFFPPGAPRGEGRRVEQNSDGPATKPATEADKGETENDGRAQDDRRIRPRDRRPDGPPGGPIGRLFGGGPVGRGGPTGGLFRASRYAADHPGITRALRAEAGD